MINTSEKKGTSATSATSATTATSATKTREVQITSSTKAEKMVVKEVDTQATSKLLEAKKKREKVKERKE